VPFAGSLAEAIDFGPPSPSVSFVRTSIAVAAASSPVEPESPTASGESSTHVTVIDAVALEPPSSVYVNVSGAPPGGLLQ
jgi:hypothetical protein